MPFAIKWHERLTLAELQYQLYSRDPVRALAVNQVAHNVERAPGAFAFISQSPGFWQITQKRVESSGGARKQKYSLLQAGFHQAPRFLHWARAGLVLRLSRRWLLFYWFAAELLWAGQVGPLRGSWK